MRLFVISSVYQMINAITVQMNDRTVHSDILCIMSLLENTFDLEKLREEKLFDNVYVWGGEIDRIRMVAKSRKERCINAAKKVGLALNKKKFLRELPKPDKQYDEICFAFPDYPSRLACETLKSKHTVISALEDGVFTYRFFEQKPNVLKNTAFRVLVGSNITKAIRKVYVYRPDMLHLRSRQAETVEIQPQLEEVGGVIKKIYKHELPDPALIDRAVIMLDQNIETATVTERQCRVANTVASVYGKDNFTVKMHPHATANPYGEAIDVCEAKCPFEILISALNMKNRVLISMLSTACMNPKMMMNVEPYVIFTAKLTCAKDTGLNKEELLKLVDDFRNLYRKPERVYVPETFEELEQILKDIKASNEQLEQ